MATVQVAPSPVPRPYVPPAPAPANDVRADDQASPAFTVPDAPAPDTGKPADAKAAKPDTNAAASAGADRGAAAAKPSGSKTAATSRAQAPGRAAANDDTDKADATSKEAAPASALALSLLAGGADAAVAGDAKAGTGDKDETKTSDPEGKDAVPDTAAALAGTVTATPVAGQVVPVAAPASSDQPPQPGAASTPDVATIGKLGAQAAAAPAPVAAATQALVAADTDVAAAAEALVASLPAEGGAGSGSAKPAAPHGKAAAAAARSAAASTGSQDGTADAAATVSVATTAKSVAGEASSGRTESTRHAGLTLQEGDAGRSAPAASAEAGVASADPALLAPTGPSPSSFGQLVSAPTQGVQAGGTQAAAATAGQPGTAATTVVSGVAISNVPVEIGMRSLSGSSHFEIRLDPVELGRIDVKLDIDATGSVRAHLLVDRPETLAFLQRDSSHLQRAFEQAGLTATSDGVALSLRQGSTDTGGGGSGRGGTPDDGASGRAQTASRSADPDTLDTAAASLATRRYLWSRPSGVDVRI